MLLTKRNEPISYQLLNLSAEMRAKTKSALSKDCGVMREDFSPFLRHTAEMRAK